MRRHFTPATLMRRTVSVSDIGEEVVSYQPYSEIELAISVIQGAANVNNNVITTSSTHLALSNACDVRVGDKIGCCGHTYNVTYIIHGRLNQIYLSEEMPYAL